MEPYPSEFEGLSNGLFKVGGIRQELRSPGYEKPGYGKPGNGKLDAIARLDEMGQLRPVAISPQSAPVRPLENEEK
jgi:hypothetical protein